MIKEFHIWKKVQIKFHKKSGKRDFIDKLEKIVHFIAHMTLDLLVLLTKHRELVLILCLCIIRNITIFKINKNTQLVLVLLMTLKFSKTKKK